ncbi:MAG: hypothetical protein M3443_08050 [Actinomycetota bacterium]|nr:hypothetical protein [Actinomycetota bacterium]
MADYDGAVAEIPVLDPMAAATHGDWSVCLTDPTRARVRPADVGFVLSRNEGTQAGFRAAGLRERIARLDGWWCHTVLVTRRSGAE